MKLLHQSSVGADYVRRARALRETEDLERLPTRHRPAAPPPPLTLTLVCLTPAGEPAVEICLLAKGGAPSGSSRNELLGEGR